MCSVRVQEMHLQPHAGPASSSEENLMDEKCICTDSVHSWTGSCPDKWDANYYRCPRREGLFGIEEVYELGKPKQEAPRLSESEGVR
jgi:hypothetical protein